MLVRRVIFWMFLPLCVLSAKVKVKKSDRLYKHLLSGYNLHFRPTEGANATIVHLNVMLNDINDIKEGTLEAVIKASVWVSMRWKDERLVWDKNRYPTDTFIISQRRIWTPDIRLFNSLDPKIRSDDNVKVTLRHDGTAMVVVPMWLTVHCYRPRLPNATWECPFRFGSWVYNGYQLDMYIRGDGFDLMGYSNKVWGITGNTSVRRVIKRRCCKESWAEVSYALRLVRR